MKDYAAPIPRRPLVGQIAICATGILLGLIPLFKSFLDLSCNCTEIVLIRIILAFVAISCILGVLSISGRLKNRITIKPKHWPIFFGYGSISLAAVYYFYIKSLDYTTATVSITTLFLACPLTALVVNLATGEEEYRFRKVFYILVMAAGCFLINFQGAGNNKLHFWGIACAFISGSCYGLYGYFGKKLVKHYDTTVMTFWQFFIALVSVLAISILAGNVPARLIVFTLMDTKEIMAGLGLGLISTFLPYLLYSYGLKQGVEATTASALSLLEAISCSLVAFIFLGENITIIQAIGIVIVVAFSTALAKA
ncbi:MAG TPA: DMT family transporter [Patescibacteria group bacterium]|nr:DMT family transporter [Patescibacteria group bacterium]